MASARPTLHWNAGALKAVSVPVCANNGRIESSRALRLRDRQTQPPRRHPRGAKKKRQTWALAGFGLPPHPARGEGGAPAAGPLLRAYETACVESAMKCVPLSFLTCISTDLLPSDFAESIAAATSDGRETALPATATMTSPV